MWKIVLIGNLAKNLKVPGKAMVREEEMLWIINDT